MRSKTGVWRDGPGLDHTLPTLAGELRRARYTSNLSGKWHLAKNERDKPEHPGLGFVKLEDRGGFDDVWEVPICCNSARIRRKARYGIGTGRRLPGRDGRL